MNFLRRLTENDFLHYVKLLMQCWNFCANPWHFWIHNVGTHSQIKMYATSSIFIEVLASWANLSPEVHLRYFWISSSIWVWNYKSCPIVFFLALSAKLGMWTCFMNQRIEVNMNLPRWSSLRVTFSGCAVTSDSYCNSELSQVANDGVSTLALCDDSRSMSSWAFISEIPVSVLSIFENFNSLLY